MNHFYTKEEEKFLIENVKGITLKELTKRFNERFGYNLSESSIANRKHKLKLKSGITGGQFIKGQQSHNKGKKWDEYLNKEQQERARATTFKKGNIPGNRRELFEERIDDDGYIAIKVQDGNLNKNWQRKHRYIYECHYGKIPKGHKVIFLDGNNRNFDIDNLKLVSNAEELIMNKRGLRYNDKELTESGVLIAKIIHKRGSLKNDRL